MMQRIWRILACAIAGVWPLGLAQTVRAQEVATSALTFEGHVRPILKAHCFHCHGEEGIELKGNLDLRLRKLIVKGGDSGPAIMAGNAAGSLLLQRITSGEMPPGDKKLSDIEQTTIERWLAAGAPTARPEPEQTTSGAEITPEERSFWSFQPVRRPSVPAVRSDDRLTPIDSFILAKLEEIGLSLSPEADRRTLIRRATFDLLGLPPTPEEVDQFLADPAPDAYERMVDRLLASPRYGERWGRHWLDVAGYSDSDGYTPEDHVRKYAYKYRDYVIRALNDDKPLDQFIQEQLAGDEMVQTPYPDLPPEAIDKLVATGFLRMGPDGTGSGGVDLDLARNQVMAETIKIVSTSLLGLSVGCAQCHTHKYDPIPQTDYYRLRAVFEPAYDVKNWRPPLARQISLYTEANRQQAAQVEAEAAKIDAERTEKQTAHIARVFEQELAKLPEEIREPIRAARSEAADKRTAEQQKLLKEHPSVNVDAGSLYLYDANAAKELKDYVDQATAVRASKPVEDFVHALTEVPGALPQTFFFVRGNHLQPKQVLPPGELSVLAPANGSDLPVDDPAVPTSGRRLAYARRLTSREHPLTARVLANRIWLHHFGRGIVATPTDFGFLGERPTHPELLDWLASELVDGGWKLKSFHKSLMTSAVYRQVSRRDAAREAMDPDNRLLGRMTVRRLEAEAVRDAIIAVSGQINDKMYGPAIPVIEDEDGQFVLGIENLNGENRPGPVIPLKGEEFRRSIYVQMRRTRPLAVLDTFDEPVMDPNCAIRNASTVAPQALLLMNNDFVLEHAGKMAQQVISASGNDPRACAIRAWQLAFSVAPTEEQLAEATAFLTAQTEQFGSAAAATPPSATGQPAPIDSAVSALTTFCQALLSANEFLYVD